MAICLYNVKQRTIYMITICFKISVEHIQAMPRNLIIESHEKLLFILFFDRVKDYLCWST